MKRPESYWFELVSAAGGILLSISNSIGLFKCTKCGKQFTLPIKRIKYRKRFLCDLCTTEARSLTIKRKKLRLLSLFAVIYIIVPE